MHRNFHNIVLSDLFFNPKRVAIELVLVEAILPSVPRGGEHCSRATWMLSHAYCISAPAGLCWTCDPARLAGSTWCVSLARLMLRSASRKRGPRYGFYGPARRHGVYTVTRCEVEDFWCTSLPHCVGITKQQAHPLHLPLSDNSLTCRIIRCNWITVTFGKLYRASSISFLKRAWF